MRIEQSRIHRPHETMLRASASAAIAHQHSLATIECEESIKQSVSVFDHSGHAMTPRREENTKYHGQQRKHEQEQTNVARM